MNIPGLEHHGARVNGVRLHYVTAGAGPAVVLLHGWPQSWYEWRRVMARLAPNFRVIAPDLRGLGDSERPAAGYDKATLAVDVNALLEHLGVAQADVVGHDWGGVVAYCLAAQFPARVRRLAVLDIALPGAGLESALALQPGGGIWHMHLHNVADLPEALVTGREGIYLGWFYRNYAHNPAAITPEDLAEYVRVYSQPGALRAGFNYYRAMFEDAAFVQAQLGRKLTLPVLAIGGAASLGAMTGMSYARAVENITAEVFDDCGHWVPEEQPQRLAERLQAFFATPTS